MGGVVIGGRLRVSATGWVATLALAAPVSKLAMAQTADKWSPYLEAGGWSDPCPQLRDVDIFLPLCRTRPRCSSAICTGSSRRRRRRRGISGSATAPAEHRLDPRRLRLHRHPEQQVRQPVLPGLAGGRAAVGRLGLPDQRLPAVQRQRPRGVGRRRRGQWPAPDHRPQFRVPRPAARRRNSRSTGSMARSAGGFRSSRRTATWTSGCMPAAIISRTATSTPSPARAAGSRRGLYDIDFLGMQSRLTAQGVIQWDQPRGTQGFAGLELRIPLGALTGSTAPKLNQLDRRMSVGSPCACCVRPHASRRPRGGSDGQLVDLDLLIRCGVVRRLGDDVAVAAAPGRPSGGPAGSASARCSRSGHPAGCATRARRSPACPAAGPIGSRPAPSAATASREVDVVEPRLDPAARAGDGVDVAVREIIAAAYSRTSMLPSAGKIGTRQPISPSTP